MFQAAGEFESCAAYFHFGEKEVLTGMNILFLGETAIDFSAIERGISAKHRLFFVGEGLVKNNKKSKASFFAFGQADAMFSKLLKSISFDAAVFFLQTSGRQSGAGGGSLEALGTTLDAAARSDVRRFILVSSTEACMPDADETAPLTVRNSNAVLLEAAEKLCMLHSVRTGMDTLILRLPNLFGDGAVDSLLQRVVGHAQAGETVALPGHPEQACDLLHADDAVALMLRMIEDDHDGSTSVVHACVSRKITYREIAAWLKASYPDCAISYLEDHSEAFPAVTGLQARRQYDWVALHDVQRSLPAWGGQVHSIATRSWQLTRALQWIRNPKWPLRLLETGVGFAIVQYLTAQSGAILQYRYIDLRLLFVVIIGSVHGTASGVIAALLACVSTLISYGLSGLDWRALVYNVDNWLPFIGYLMAGVVTGYVREKSQYSMQFERDRYQALEKRYAYLDDIYRQTLEHKGIYRDQIISYRDSYGKVYEAASRLDSMVTDAVFQEAVHIVEELFGKSTAAIYTIGENHEYARLEVSSPDLSDCLQRSLSRNQYSRMFDAMKDDQVWVNRSMLEGYPFYATLIRIDAQTSAVVMVYDVPYELKTASGANQLLVLCRLIQSALARAVQYRKATQEMTCLDGTQIMRSKAFEELLSVRREMKRRKLSDFTLLRVDNDSLDLRQLSDRIESGIRRTDFIGQGADGSIYILLVQAQANVDQQMVGRLARLGLRCVSVDDETSAVSQEPILSEAL